MEVLSLQEAKRAYPPLFIVYDHPRDYPRWIVVRVWYGEWPSDETILRVNLEMARKAIWTMGGEVKLPKNTFDDPVILESWI